MDSKIEEIISCLKSHAKNSVDKSSDILNRSGDYFSKYQARYLKFQAEDSINLLSELEGLLLGDKNSYSEGILQEYFNDFDISVSALNALNNNAIYTIGDLLGYTKKEFSKLKNVGKRTADEMEKFLNARNLKFK